MDLLINEDVGKTNISGRCPSFAFIDEFTFWFFQNRVSLIKIIQNECYM